MFGTLQARACPSEYLVQLTVRLFAVFAADGNGNDVPVSIYSVWYRQLAYRLNDMTGQVFKLFIYIMGDMSTVMWLQVRGFYWQTQSRS